MDKYGHCIVCHDNLLYDAVIDGKIEKRFSPRYSETEYLLDDGSRMKVCVCKTCKPNMKDTDKEKEEIMMSVYKGWEHEVKKSDWNEDRKKSYLDRYKQRNIICKSAGLSNDILAKQLNRHKKNKEKANGSNI